MYNRTIIDKLQAWKQQTNRKPILLDGARQTGKSYLLKELFGAQFNQVLVLDFLENPELADIFSNKKTPEYLLQQIEYTLDTEFDPNTDLLILDEIGECQNAVDSLKYFAEKAPQMFVCASGSNIGLLNSFPVGKVTGLEMHPMSFEEFLMASGSKAIVNAWRQREMSPALHRKLFQHLKDYYYVGGMPEAVAAWFNEDSLRNRVKAVSQIHFDLVAGYVRDFGKYADVGNKVNAAHIEAIFRNIPLQLRTSLDDSVNRYRFKEVIPKKNRYRELAGPIDWLVKTHLVSKNYIIETPKTPLAAYRQDNLFKLFMFDIGLLGHMLDLKYDEHQDQNYAFKGYVTENFAQNEMLITGYNPTYAWRSGESKIEFLYPSENGSIIPVEIKSGARTKAKSLSVFIKKHKPNKALKFIGSDGSDKDQTLQVLPLYYVSHIAKL